MLIAGEAGFSGRHMVMEAARAGFKVRATDVGSRHYGAMFDALGVEFIQADVTRPTYMDWQNPDVWPYLEKYLGGADPHTAEKRMKVMSALHHVTAGDFAGWHEVRTIHAERSFAAQKKTIMAEAPIDRYINKAKEAVGLNV